MNYDNLTITNPTAEVRQAVNEQFAEDQIYNEPEEIIVVLPCTQVPDALEFLVELAERTNETIAADFAFEYLDFDVISTGVRPDRNLEMLGFLSREEQPDLSEDEIWEKFESSLRLGSNWGSVTGQMVKELTVSLPESTVTPTPEGVLVTPRSTSDHTLH